jgi:hypothetical protein
MSASTAQVASASVALRLGVVQLDGIPWARTGKYLWYPAEPLLDEDSRTSRLPEMAAGKLFALHATDAYAELERICERAAEAVLHDVLGFLDNHEIDIVVFPESQVPPSFLPHLMAFARGRVVVAGLGTIRTEEESARIASVAGVTEQAELRDRNVSVLIDDGKCHFVTKGAQADNEFVTDGEGVVIQQVTVRGHQFRLGVAVCKDYLVSEKKLWDDQADIVCIPAFTPSSAEFEANAPRNYARLLANTARFGGTQIMAPELDDPFTDRKGVDPLPRDRQGVIVVDFDGYKPKITGYVQPKNRLVLRAEIIERSAANRSTLAAIERLSDPLTGSNMQKGQEIERMLDTMDRARPVAVALEQCQVMYCTGFDPSDFIERLVRPHLSIDEGYGHKSVRRQQVELILETLKDLVVNNPKVVKAGEALTHYRELANKYQVVDGATITRRRVSDLRPDSDGGYTYQGHVSKNGSVTEPMAVPGVDVVELDVDTVEAGGPVDMSDSRGTS